MQTFKGNTLSWELLDGVVELALHRQPNNEIGSATLEELERFVETLQAAQGQAHAVIIHSTLPSGFSAGAMPASISRP